MLAPSYLPEAKQNLVADLTEGLDSGALNWLSGYFAGIAQGKQGVQSPPAIVSAVARTDSAQQLTIIYGSQTGNAKRLAESFAERVGALGLTVRLVRADRYTTRELKDEQLLYIVMSTQGDGEPPDDSIAFVEFLNSRRAPKLPQLKYAVLGLGDSSYPLFCGIAQNIDTRLAELGAQRLQDVGTADLDIETIALPWQDQAIGHAQKTLEQTAPPSASVTALHPEMTSKVTRDRPFQAELLQNQAITGQGSTKDIRHLEISLAGSNLSYQPGDSLGVWPTQADTLVTQVVSTLELDPGESIEINNVVRPLKDWLGQYRELTQLTKPFLVAHAELARNDALHHFLKPEGQDALRNLLETRQLIDVLKQYPAPWTGPALVKALRPLTPRLYSIASSQTTVDEEVHLTLANVAYEHDGEPRWGAASNFLTQLKEGDTLPIFIEENTRFRLPEDSSRDIILIGPGTGIAPFRAFVQERSAQGASGRNWLFFGNPNFDSDFLYQTEWQRAVADGHLHRMNVAFSRDQEQKVYVQHKLLECATDLYDWIESGAHIYVCGDATRMAKDVHQTLLQIAQSEGGLDESQAKLWLDDLAAQGRYARDVY